MAVGCGRTEVLELGEESMTSSPVNASGKAADKASVMESVIAQQRRDALHEANCSQQAHAKDSVTVSSDGHDSSAINPNHTVVDIHATPTAAVNVQANIATPQHRMPTAECDDTALLPPLVTDSQPQPLDMSMPILQDTGPRQAIELPHTDLSQYPPEAHGVFHDMTADSQAQEGSGEPVSTALAAGAVMNDVPQISHNRAKTKSSPDAVLNSSDSNHTEQDHNNELFAREDNHEPLVQDNETNYNPASQHADQALQTSTIVVLEASEPTISTSNTTNAKQDECTYPLSETTQPVVHDEIVKNASTMAFKAQSTRVLLVEQGHSGSESHIFEQPLPITPSIVEPLAVSVGQHNHVPNDIEQGELRLPVMQSNSCDVKGDIETTDQYAEKQTQSVWTQKAYRQAVSAGDFDQAHSQRISSEAVSTQAQTATSGGSSHGCTISSPTEIYQAQIPSSSLSAYPPCHIHTITSQQTRAASPDRAAPKTAQETTLAELKTQRSALLASLAALPVIQVLIEDAASSGLEVDGIDTGPTETEIVAAASKIVKDHIKLLHEYNELKDVGQGLMGLIADQRGVRIVEVQDEFGIDTHD